MTCRVLKIARQSSYCWLTTPVTKVELEEANRANASFDAHRDGPEFGYRFLVDEAREAGESMTPRTARKICSSNGWWSAFWKKKGPTNKAGPPVHDDLVQRDFTAAAAKQVWLGDLTERWSGEGTLRLIAFKDRYSNRIVGYSIGSRMKSHLVVAALNTVT